MIRSRLTLAVAALAAVAALVAGCTSSGSAKDSQSSSRATAAAPKSASAAPAAKVAPVYQGKIPAAKSIGNVVTKRKAVTLAGCAATAGGWKATGTAKNTGTKSAKYTITVFFTTSKATVQSYAKTTVDVAAGSSAQWTATRAFPAAKGTLCVLRGVA